MWGARVLVAALVFLRAFFDPYPAGTGLGPSWQLALTQASLRGLVFGRDVIFTYGPLAYLAVGVGVGPAYWQMLACSVTLALGVAILVAYCATERRSLLPGLGFVLVVLVCLTDIMPIDILSFAFIVAFTLPQFRARQATPLAALLLGLACGIALLMKFNIGVSSFVAGIALFGLRAAAADKAERARHLTDVFLFCAGAAVSAATVFARLDYGLAVTVALAVAALSSAVALSRPGLSLSRRRSAAVVAGLCAVALLASPSFRAFAGTSLQVAAGYSGAMSFDGPGWELWFAVGIFALLFLTFVANVKTLSVPVVVALLVSLFFGYKEGFVRQDLHVIYAFWTALLIAGVILRLSADRRLLAINGFVAVLAFFAFNVVWRASGAGGAPHEAMLPGAISQDFTRLARAWHNDDEIAKAYAEGLAPDRLPRAVIDAIGSSSVHAGPIESSIVFANGFNWNPEPIFQAYSAYTPELDGIDARHDESAGAARILFNWDSIDGRYPLWDEPAATREMICNYGVDPAVPGSVATAGDEEVLVIRRVRNRCGVATEGVTKTYSWDEPIRVAATPANALSFVHLRVRYSPLGQFLKLLFRAPSVYAHVSDSQGNVSDYRIVVENSEDGLLVAPFPQSLEQLQGFFEKKNLAQVRSIQLTSNAKYFFGDRIECTISLLGYGAAGNAHDER